MKRRGPTDLPNLPRPFGVDYVPKTRRAKGKMIYIGRVLEIPPGKSKAIELEKFRVAVFNVDGRFYAIKDACPHAQYPLSRGYLKGEVVMCANHNWQFNVRTGECLRGDPETKARQFKVQIKGDEVWLNPE